MTSSAGARDGEAQTQGQSRHLALLTETEPGRRNRRTIDSVFLVVAAIVIGLSAAIASSRTGHDHDVGQALTTVLGWAGALWRAAFVGLLGLAAAIVVDVLLRRRWDLARDLLVAELGAFGLAVLLGRAVESEWFPVEPICSLAGAIRSSGSPLRRRSSSSSGRSSCARFACVATWLVPLAALAGVVLGAALPSGALAALALGLGAGALAAARLRHGGGRAADRPGPRARSRRSGSR